MIGITKVQKLMDDDFLSCFQQAGQGYLDQTLLSLLEQLAIWFHLTKMNRRDVIGKLLSAGPGLTSYPLLPLPGLPVGKRNHFFIITYTQISTKSHPFNPSMSIFISEREESGFSPSLLSTRIPAGYITVSNPSLNASSILLSPPLTSLTSPASPTSPNTTQQRGRGYLGISRDECSCNGKIKGPYLKPQVRW